MASIWRSPIVSAFPADLALEPRDGCVTAARGRSAAEVNERIRRAIAVSDASAMGKFRLSGPGALEAANRAVLSDVSRLPIQRILVSFMLRPDGRPLCDVHVVNEGESYLLLTEGAAPEEVAAALAGAGARFDDLTREIALLSLDGPFAWELMKELAGTEILGARYLDFVPERRIGSEPVQIYRAGRAGEYSYWVGVEAARAEALFRHVQDAGARYGIAVAGFEDVDRCKLENRNVNMDKEGRGAGNVLELNCRVMVSRDKGEYVGQPAVEGTIGRGVGRRIVGLRADGSAALPEGATVCWRDEPIGTVANSAHSFVLGKTIAVAFLDTRYAYVGLDYAVRTPGGSVPVRTASAPFVNNRSLSVRPQEDSYFAAR